MFKHIGLVVLYIVQRYLLTASPDRRRNQKTSNVTQSNWSWFRCLLSRSDSAERCRCCCRWWCCHDGDVTLLTRSMSPADSSWVHFSDVASLITSPTDQQQTDRMRLTRPALYDLQVTLYFSDESNSLAD